MVLLLLLGGVRGVNLTFEGNGYDDSNSNPWTGLFAFSQSANTLGKGMNSIILNPTMGK